MLAFLTRAVVADLPHCNRSLCSNSFDIRLFVSAYCVFVADEALKIAFQVISPALASARCTAGSATAGAGTGKAATHHACPAAESALIDRFCISGVGGRGQSAGKERQIGAHIRCYAIRTHLRIHGSVER